MLLYIYCYLLLLFMIMTAFLLFLYYYHYHYHYYHYQTQTLHGCPLWKKADGGAILSKNNRAERHHITRTDDPSGH